MTRRYRDAHSPEVDLPITPMLDMAFQLLTFFIMTYHPSNLEGQFPLTLIAAEQKAGSDQEKVKPEAAPSTVLSEGPAPVTVAAKAGPGGVLESLSVFTLGGDHETIKDAQGNVEAMINALSRRLRQIKADQNLIGSQDERLVLRASDTLRWEETVAVMDACRQTKDGTKLFPKLELDRLKAGS